MQRVASGFYLFGKGILVLSDFVLRGVFNNAEDNLWVLFVFARCIYSLLFVFLLDLVFRSRCVFLYSTLQMVTPCSL